MKGYRILFFTQENRTVHGRPVAEWILETARKLGAPGGTMIFDAAGFGHSRRMHSAGFFEMADRPVTVSVTAKESTCEALMDAITAEQMDIFYCRNQVEFGRLGGEAADRA